MDTGLILNTYVCVAISAQVDRSSRSSVEVRVEADGNIEKVGVEADGKWRG